MDLSRLELECQQDWVPLEALGQNPFLGLSQLPGVPAFLSSALLPIFRVYHSDLSFCLFLLLSDHTRPLWMYWDHPHSLVSLSHLKVFTFITSAKSILPCKVTQSQVLRLEWGHLGGRHCSIYHTIFQSVRFKLHDSQLGERVEPSVGKHLDENKDMEEKEVGKKGSDHLAGLT